MITPLIALIFGTIGLGGECLETLIVDRVWPDNLAIIQPQRGGLDRKRFWIPVHTLYEVALLVSVSDIVEQQVSLDIALSSLWSLISSHELGRSYFIPKALRFEKLSELSESDAQLARR